LCRERSPVVVKYSQETGRTLMAGETGGEIHASKTALWRIFYARNSVRSKPIRTFEVSIDGARGDRLYKCWVNWNLKFQNIVVNICKLSKCLEIRTLRESKSGDEHNRRKGHHKTNQTCPRPPLRDTRDGRESARARRSPRAPRTLWLSNGETCDRSRLHRLKQ
jgi:hypothetical protein